MIRSLRTAATLVATTAATAALALTSASPAAADPGDTSLAEVLAADGNRFDRNAQDFDVLERAVLLVLDQRPNSRVSIVADGDRRVTGFLPTDQAFKRLVRALTGEQPATERDTFRAVRSLGVDTVNDVLLYHLLPGRTLTSEKVLAARGTNVNTALGAPIKVIVRKGDVFLGDRDFDATNPQVVALDVNRGNFQVGHAIDRVLRPVDL